MTILDEIRAENAEWGARILANLAEFRHEMDKRFESIDERFERIDERFERIDERFDRVDARFATLEGKVADVKSDLMKWSFVFWCGAVLAVAALAGVLGQ